MCLWGPDGLGHFFLFILGRWKNVSTTAGFAKAGKALSVEIKSLCVLSSSPDMSSLPIDGSTKSHSVQQKHWFFCRHRLANPTSTPPISAGSDSPLGPRLFDCLSRSSSKLSFQRVPPLYTLVQINKVVDLGPSRRIDPRPLLQSWPRSVVAVVLLCVNRRFVDLLTSTFMGVCACALWFTFVMYLILELHQVLIWVKKNI